MTWDTTVDFVSVGSGGGGMVAALAAADAGASALVLEKQALLGGSTCMSGGIMWVPDNPVMRAAGVEDSYADAMAHFEAVVGDVGPASSHERRHAFLAEGAAMVSFLQDRGVRFVFEALNSNVLLYNYPGVGNSGGWPSAWGMIEAQHAMKAFLADAEHGLNANEVVVWGHSIGAGVQGDALNVQDPPVREHPELVRYVFVKSRTFDSLSNAAK